MCKTPTHVYRLDLYGRKVVQQDPLLFYESVRGREISRFFKNPFNLTWIFLQGKGVGEAHVGPSGRSY